MAQLPGFIIVIASLMASHCWALDTVPTLIWSTRSSLWDGSSRLPAGQVLSEPELHNLLTPALANDNLVLFLQDKLSIEDFTQYGDGAFPHIQWWLQNSGSQLVLPAVSWHATVGLASWLSRGQNVSELKSGQPLNSLPRIGPGLLLVRLEDTRSSDFPPVKEALANNDKRIDEVMRWMQRNERQFTAVYTARRPSKQFESTAGMLGGSGRRLLAASTTQSPPVPTQSPLAFGNYSGSPCILLWASQIFIVIDKETFDLTKETFSKTPDTAGSLCNTSSALLSINYTNLNKSASNLVLNFSLSNEFYPVSAQNWFTLDKVSVLWNGNLSDFNTFEVSAPEMYSFRCQLLGTSSRAGSRLTMNTKNKKAISLELHDFQIQAFNLKGNYFAYASDCASFFTPAIWMGLVSCGFLILILTYGLHMLLQLKTMDRFDDPKGPGISAPQAD
uniref:ATPase H+ transporting accessory protein 1b n=1 Tax=Eptatretus burgeri TaxID=7764 RepID=A0A8C4Q730_EPTBU